MSYLEYDLQPRRSSGATLRGGRPQVRGRGPATGGPRARPPVAGGRRGPGLASLRGDPQGKPTRLHAYRRAERTRRPRPAPGEPAPGTRRAGLGKRGPVRRHLPRLDPRQLRPRDGQSAADRGVRDALLLLRRRIDSRLLGADRARPRLRHARRGPPRDARPHLGPAERAARRRRLDPARAEIGLGLERPHREPRDARRTDRGRRECRIAAACACCRSISPAFRAAVPSTSTAPVLCRRASSSSTAYAFPTAG